MEIAGIDVHLGVPMLKLGWFSTGRGEGSRGFLELIRGRIDAGVLDAEIEFVFSNREPGEAEGSDEFFRLVRGRGIPLVTLSSRRFRREHGGGPFSRHRLSYHREAMKLISGFDPDVSVLAGYMLFTGAEMCRRYKMINLHPASPRGPAGTWQDVIWKLIEDGAAESGVMVHVATEVLDEGPVLTYCTFPIRGGRFGPLWRETESRPIEDIRSQGEEQPMFRLIRQEGMKRERPLLLETLRALAESRVRIEEGRVLDAGGTPIEGQCLNEEVERFIGSP